jgi:hypothetical protein
MDWLLPRVAKAGSALFPCPAATHLDLLELPRVLRAGQHEARLLLLQLGALLGHHDAEQLVL